ncbi:ABC transporter ATP-binding protein [Rhodoflexus sp.]
MLRLQNIFYSYGSLEALRGVSFDMAAGEIHGLVGMNGAGKTTLLQLISGLLRLQQGEISLGGQPIAQRDIAFLPTHNYLYSYITGDEYLSLFRVQSLRTDFEALNRIFRLPLHRLVDEYSAGMRKKLAFMALMALDRPVFVLDEPFNSVDIEGVMAFQQAIRLLAQQGKTLLITSHIFESLTEICDHIHYLNNGSIDGSYDRAAFFRLQHLLRHTFEQDHREDWRRFFG